MYLLTSMRVQQTTGPELIRLTRAYWAATENGVHRVGDRDGAWSEDALRARKWNLSRVLASVANLALSILCMVRIQNFKQALEELTYSPRGAGPRRALTTLRPPRPQPDTTQRSATAPSRAGSKSMPQVSPGMRRTCQQPSPRLPDRGLAPPRASFSGIQPAKTHPSRTRSYDGISLEMAAAS